MTVIVPIHALMLREVPRPEKVEQFRQLLCDGHKLPPIAITRYADASSGIAGNDKRRWLCLNGHHRVAAARAAGRAYVHAVEVSWS